MTLRYGNNVDDLILLEYGRDFDGLLEQAVRKLDFVSHRATVNLDLHKVSLLLRETGLADLSVCKNADNSAVFANTLKFAGNRLAAIFSMLLSVTREGLLLRAVPVLVEASFELIRQMRGPDSGEGTETTRSLNIADDANDDERRSLDNGDGFNDFALVHF